MRKLLLAACLLWLSSGSAFASPTAPVAGADYTVLTNPQPVSSTGKKVEVIEFFMYHCPACYQLEPALLAWVKKQGDNITFKRVHLPHNGDKDAETRMFLTLQALGLEDTLHAKILNTWHVEHKMLRNDDDNINWAIQNGIDKNRYIDTYFSFSVASKISALPRLAESYLVNSTPTLVVDGRFVTGPAVLQQGNPGMPIADLDTGLLQVADYLVEKAKAQKK